MKVFRRPVPTAALLLAGAALFFALGAPGARARNAYVTNQASDSVSVIGTATNQAVGGPIKVGAGAREIAIAPDGSRAYVSSRFSKDITVIDTRTNQMLGAPIGVGDDPIAIALTPDGKKLYVAQLNTESVLVIDTATNTVVGALIKVGDTPRSIAITPDGSRAYVVDETLGAISVIDTRANQLVGLPVKVGTDPRSVAFTPDGSRAYVANEGSGDVSVIDTATSQVVGGPIGVGEKPFGVAIVPDQPPLASFNALPAFNAPRARPGVPVSFNASASKDPDGTISAHAWSFGDGRVSVLGSATETHTYARPGSYRVTLSLTDDEGCSTSLIFTGQTAFCNGKASAQATRRVKVSYPGVRVRCPRNARPRGCRFELQAVARKPKPGRRAKVESAVARAKVRPGRAAIVSLRPNASHRRILARARNVLVKETEEIGGLQRVRFRRLRIVQ